VSEFKREVEIKFKIDKDILSKLKNIKLEMYEEVDEYFFTKDNVDGDVYLRFRKKKGKIFLGSKVIVLGGENTKDVYEADEIETEITSEQYENIKKIFNVFFPINIQIRKIRSKGKFNECEICLDKVDDLGDFLEIEGPKDKILEICKNLNINMENRDKERGYAKMTLKKMGLI
jgi:predicted adenylyl cyclase CyaB